MKLWVLLIGLSLTFAPVPLAPSPVPSPPLGERGFERPSPSGVRGESTPDREWLIRVGLERQASGKEIYIQSQGGAFRWIDVDRGRALGESPAGTLWRVARRGEELIAIQVAPSPVNKPISARRLRAEPVGDALLAVGVAPSHLKPFRGAMEWQASNDRLLTINWVRLDDYLKAVLPAEIPPRFHPEALKAQAVAARSFTFRRLNRHRDSGYDLCDTEHCQLYGGVAGEHPATSQAVEATAGEVLWHNGRVFEALYSSNCGGHTAPSEGIRSASQEPLPGTLDWDFQTGRYYCDIAPNARWSLTLTPDELQRAFPDAGTPRELKILQRTLSGHVALLQLRGERATIEIRGSLFRQRLGVARVRSLLFTLEPDGNGWRLTGRGYGHGMGLCQWGAQGRALAGQTYPTILQAYYPGVSLASLTTGINQADTPFASRETPQN